MSFSDNPKKRHRDAAQQTLCKTVAYSMLVSLKTGQKCIRIAVAGTPGIENLQVSAPLTDEDPKCDEPSANKYDWIRTGQIQ